MTIHDYRTQFAQSLVDHYPDEEITSLAFLGLEHVLGMNRVEVTLSRNQILNPQQQQELLEVLERLKNHEPIQYIIGAAEFYGLALQVNPSTLIPRPETEELVAWVLKEAGSDRNQGAQSALKVLDVGTGSGCIAIALAKQLPEAKVEAVDISQQALETAYNNANRNAVKVTFFRQDILAAEKLEKHYDIIVSNPPYVRELEKAEMRDNVLQSEPDRALFVPDDNPLLFYRKIGALALESLTTSGMLFFEINEYLGPETVAMLKDLGFKTVELREDMFGKDRMIMARR